MRTGVEFFMLLRRRFVMYRDLHSRTSSDMELELIAELVISCRR